MSHETSSVASSDLAIPVTACLTPWFNTFKQSYFYRHVVASVSLDNNQRPYYHLIIRRLWRSSLYQLLVLSFSFLQTPFLTQNHRPVSFFFFFLISRPPPSSPLFPSPPPFR